MKTPNALTKYDSKTEAEYAAHLDLLKHAGEIKAWYYQPIRLRISNKPEGSAGKRRATAFYTPDFGVVRNDDVYELHEVKGFWRKDAWVRIRAAAALHPFVFAAIYKEQGSFVREDI